MRQIALDTETTGLSPGQGDRLVEIAAIELIDRRLSDKRFHCYLNPERDVPLEAERVHGLSAEFLADKPLFPAVADELLDFLKDAELIIHNAPFDLGFLHAELKRMAHSCSDLRQHCVVVDTLQLARRRYPGQSNTLDALCQRLQVDNSQRQQHGALLDTELLARVYLAMTGGQTDLPLESRPSHPAATAIAMAARPQLCLAPDERELAAHQALLNRIDKESPAGCLWLEQAKPSDENGVDQ